MELQFFALKGTGNWGRKIEEHLEIPLGLLEERDFEDGEQKTRPLENVRDRDVFVLISLHTDLELTTHDKICRLLFFIGALKDANAKSVTAVIPYFAYARKDQKTKPRDPITLKYLAKMIEAAGADRVMTMDIHNLSAFQNAFRIPVENLEAHVLFAPFIAKHLPYEEMVIISPDAGGIKRAEVFRSTLSKLLNKNIGMSFLDKTRQHDVVKGGGEFKEVMENKVAIIYDDMISSGQTIQLAVNALYEKGASRIFVCVTHCLYLEKIKELLSDQRIEKILVTDSIAPFRFEQDILKQKMIIMDSSLLFARAMKRIQSGESIIELQENYPATITELPLLS